MAPPRSSTNSTLVTCHRMRAVVRARPRRRCTAAAAAATAASAAVTRRLPIHRCTNRRAERMRAAQHLLRPMPSAMPDHAGKPAATELTQRHDRSSSSTAPRAAAARQAMGCCPINGCRGRVRGAAAAADVVGDAHAAATCTGAVRQAAQGVGREEPLDIGRAERRASHGLGARFGARWEGGCAHLISVRGHVD